MEEFITKRKKLITALAILLFIGSATYLVLEIRANSQLEEDLRNERLNTETFLSEKLLLEKEIGKLGEEIRVLSAKNKDLDHSLTSEKNKLEQVENELQKIHRHNRNINELRRANQQLTILKDELEQQVIKLTAAQQQLQESTDDMNQLIAFLQAENKKLKADLDAARLTINDVRIESARRNDKLTAKAKQTKKLTATFIVPVDAENLKFKIISPEGRELNNTTENLTVRVLSNEVNKSDAFYVDANSSSAGTYYKRIEVMYAPAMKLKTGTYKIDVVNESMSIGSLQVRLM